jgi:hypothetical protein
VAAPPLSLPAFPRRRESSVVESTMQSPATRLSHQMGYRADLAATRHEAVDASMHTHSCEEHDLG